MKKTNPIAILASLLILGIPHHIFATELNSPGRQITDPAIFAQVNGLNLSTDMFNFLLHSRVQDHIDESEEDIVEVSSQSHLQEKAANDLIMTTLLAQQATASDLHNSAQFQLELELFEQTLLAQLFVQQIMDDIQIDESLIRKRYEQQAEQVLYRFMIWETSDQETAVATLKALNDTQHPLTANPQVKEVETPWLLGSDMDPQVQEKIVDLSMNDFIQAPIQQDGIWKVVQLIDKRAMARQDYALEREMIRADMVAEKLQSTLDTLKAQATIVINQDYSLDPPPR